jgi:hypothetical protein
VFDTSGVRLVGEFVNDEGDSDEDRLLDVDIDDGDEQSSLLLPIPFDVKFSFSQSTSLMIIMRLFEFVDVISTSSSELPDSDDREQLIMFLLLLSSLQGTRNVNLFLLNKFLRLRFGSVSGNGS